MGLQSHLIRIVQRLSFCREIGDVIFVLREAARDLTGADGVTVVLREGEMCHYAEENAISPLWKGRRFPMQACISGWCMLHRQQVAIPDIYADARIPQDAYRPTFVRSLVMTPIRSEEPIGAIGAYWASRHEATAQELEILQALADSASMAISNVQLFEALKESGRRKDEFLAMLAHELRNPLAPIRNALHLLLRRPDDGETVARMSEIMDRQVGHLVRLVDDLLEVSRLTRGRIKIHHERLDLVRVVRQSAEDRRGVLERLGLRLRLELPEVPVWIVGDATRLGQVLDILLDNAGKFNPAGSQVTVSIGLSELSGEALLTVRDTGIGVDPALLPQIFESFTQADRSLERSKGGLGLGLSIAKGLVELHGGKIEAHSQGAGCGTAFVIRLPRVSERPALAGGSVPAKALSKPCRILVVEDNRDSADSLRLLLEACGYDVSVAYSGPDGVQTATAVQPDIILCDVGLPGMDGFALAGTLRANPATAKTRLIAITGYGEEQDRRRALDAGFDLHLVKPVDPDRLLRHLSVA